MEILNKEALTYSEVKELLNESSKNLRTERLKEFLNSFNILDKEKAIQLKEELLNLDITRLKGKENVIIQIVNLLPKTKEELIQILAGEKITLPEESLEKILETVKKYL
jgi:DNA-directed RNA polymerase subunit F